MAVRFPPRPPWEVLNNTMTGPSKVRWTCVRGAPVWLTKCFICLVTQICTIHIGLNGIHSIVRSLSHVPTALQLWTSRALQTDNIAYVKSPRLLEVLLLGRKATPSVLYASTAANNQNVDSEFRSLPMNGGKVNQTVKSNGG